MILTILCLDENRLVLKIQGLPLQNILHKGENTIHALIHDLTMCDDHFGKFIRNDY